MNIMNTVNQGSSKVDEYWICCNCAFFEISGVTFVSRRFHEKCVLCEHDKCDNCLKDYVLKEIGEVDSLSGKGKKVQRETNQTPIRPTFRVSSLVLNQTFSTEILEAGEDNLDAALTCKEYRPHTNTEPHNGPEARNGSENIFVPGYSYSQCSSGESGEAGCLNSWGLAVESSEAAGSIQCIEPQALVNNPAGTGDWTFPLGYFPPSHHQGPEIQALQPSTAICEHPQNINKEPLSRLPPCHKKDLNACDSCRLDDAVLEKPLACPFYKLNPERYSRCMHKGFKEISGLTQHLRNEKSHGEECIDMGGIPIDQLPPVPKTHQKNSNWKWYWTWGKLFGRHPAPKCPYLHPNQDMKAHNLHQSFRELAEAQNAGLDVGYAVQYILQSSYSTIPLSDSQFMDSYTLHLAQYTHNLGQFRGHVTQENIDFSMPWNLNVEPISDSICDMI